MLYTEDYLSYPDGSRIRFRLNKYTNRINIVLVHGLGERLEFHEKLFSLFNDAGMALHAVELRGHGLSTGEAKYIDDFEEYGRDVKRFIASYLNDREIILMGFSTGATVMSSVALDRRISVKALVFISPLIELQANIFQKMLIHILGTILPKFEMPTSDEGYAELTHVEEHRQWLIDEGRRTRMGTTMGFLRSFLRERKRILSRGHLLAELPTLIMLAGGDVILDIKKIRKDFEIIHGDSGHLTVIEHGSAWHNMLFDEEGEEYVAEIISWIRKLKKG